MSKQREAHAALVEEIRQLLREDGAHSPTPTARNILSLIAERLGEVTEEMQRAGFKVNVWNNPATCDNPRCIGRVTMPADNAFRAMLAASALVPGDGK